eukprot:8823123-Pyramimonas_sp.AAC.1
MEEDVAYVPALAWPSAPFCGNFCLGISAATLARNAAWIFPPGPRSASVGSFSPALPRGLEKS